ncbi:uncharacterized protein Tco025E_05927 [Trypanosoma conorhini]|uniref:Uncharacterized protein n=1 Tax=Trypanosoma conorhini TaxID=83891 RepID=A0A422P8V9_9TRYP|nr:uncharacterized protein Tco025E_05927 [Trypanosoma conorhini]RNF14161.1 hypothetical protein Tco025E_05927 [Trypanosoma conorhini]
MMASVIIQFLAFLLCTGACAASPAAVVDAVDALRPLPLRTGPVTASATATATPSASVTADHHRTTVPLSSSVTPSATLAPPPPERTVTASGHHTVTPAVTPSLSPQAWVDVYFEVENVSLTPVRLVALLRRVVWSGTSVEMVAGGVFADTWDQVFFESARRAGEAVAAANEGEVPGVRSASYAAPAAPTHKSSDTTVVVVVVVVVIVVLALAAAGVLFCRSYYRGKDWRSGRYDEDFAMNSATTPVNLNELLLTNLGGDGRRSQDHKSVAS